MSELYYQIQKRILSREIAAYMKEAAKEKGEATEHKNGPASAKSCGE